MAGTVSCTSAFVAGEMAVTRGHMQTVIKMNARVDGSSASYWFRSGDYGGSKTFLVKLSSSTDS